MIANHVFRQLNARGMMFLRNELAATDNVPSRDWKLPESFILMDSTNQTQALHTIIRDARTSMHDFIFYSDRLSRLVRVPLSLLYLTLGLYS